VFHSADSGGSKFRHRVPLNIPFKPKKYDIYVEQIPLKSVLVDSAFQTICYKRKNSILSAIFAKKFPRVEVVEFLPLID
jgi:hypothetical protein